MSFGPIVSSGQVKSVVTAPGQTTTSTPTPTPPMQDTVHLMDPSLSVDQAHAARSLFTRTGVPLQASPPPPAAPVPGAPPSPPPPPALTGWNQIRQIYSQIAADDASTRANIQKLSHDQSLAETAAAVTNANNWSTAVYTAADAFLASIPPPAKKK